MKNVASLWALWGTPPLELKVWFRMKNVVNLLALWRTRPLLESRTVLICCGLEWWHQSLDLLLKRIESEFRVQDIEMSKPAGKDPGRLLVLRVEALNLVHRCRHSGNFVMGRLTSLGSVPEFLLDCRRLNFSSAT